MNPSDASERESWSEREQALYDKIYADVFVETWRQTRTGATTWGEIAATAAMVARMAVESQR